jgi:hypothetical protein
MSIDASRAPSSGPQRSARRAYTSAEINKINKSDFNRERNSLLAIIATIERAYYTPSEPSRDSLYKQRPSRTNVSDTPRPATT